MTIDSSHAEKRLQARRNELEAHSRLSEAARGTVELDQQAVGRLSRMDAMQQKAMADAQQRTRERDLQRIEQAFRRLRDGDYGFCIDCDRELPDGRLEIDPMAERCVKCA